MAVWLSLILSQGTPNETARTNTVTATVKVHYSGGSYNGNSPSGTLTINGQSFSFTCNFNYAGIGQGAASTGTGSVTACTRTVTVSYGSSSTKTVSASASFASGTGSGTVSASDSITLTPISAGGSSGGGDDDDDNTEEWDPDNPGSSGGSGGGDSGGTEFPYEHTVNFIIGDHCKVEFIDVGYGHNQTISISQSIKIGSISPGLYAFSFIADEGYKLIGCFVNGVACDDDGYETLTAYNGEYTIIALAAQDDSGSVNARGVFYIDNGTEHTAFQCYIDNGTGWDPVGGPVEVSGAVNTNASGSSARVYCGFDPDLVVLHLNETYDGTALSCAASFDVHNGPVVTSTYSVANNGVVGLIVDREYRGFSVISYLGDPSNSISLTFNYVAIKYT